MIRTLVAALCCLFVAGFGLAGPGQAQNLPDPGPAPAGSEAAPGAGEVALEYIPPLRGAPGSRVGGGTRGDADGGPGLVALVPDHPGRSATPSPSLFWYLSAPTDKPMEWVLNDEQAGATVAGGPLPQTAKAGVQGLDLAGRGIRLTPGVPYAFFVIIKADADEPSRNTVAGGQIVHVAPTAEVKARLDQARGNPAGALAREGYWFDALAAALAKGRGSGLDGACGAQARALLAQAGLEQVTAACPGKP